MMSEYLGEGNHDIENCHRQEQRRDFQSIEAMEAWMNRHTNIGYHRAVSVYPAQFQLYYCEPDA